jgi:hypothetical protein
VCWDTFSRENGAIWAFSRALGVGGSSVCTDANAQVDRVVWVGVDAWRVLRSMLGEGARVGTCVVFGAVGSASVACSDVGGVFPGIDVCADVDMQVGGTVWVDVEMVVGDRSWVAMEIEAGGVVWVDTDTRVNRTVWVDVGVSVCLDVHTWVHNSVWVAAGALFGVVCTGMEMLVGGSGWVAAFVCVDADMRDGRAIWVDSQCARSSAMPCARPFSTHEKINFSTSRICITSPSLSWETEAADVGCCSFADAGIFFVVFFLLFAMPK